MLCIKKWGKKKKKKSVLLLVYWFTLFPHVIVNQISAKKLRAFFRVDFDLAVGTGSFGGHLYVECCSEIHTNGHNDKKKEQRKKTALDNAR